MFTNEVGIDVQIIVGEYAKIMVLFPMEIKDVPISAGEARVAADYAWEKVADYTNPNTTKE